MVDQKEQLYKECSSEFTAAGYQAMWFMHNS